MGEMQLESRQLADAQRRLSGQAQPEGSSADAQRRQAAEQTRLAERTERLEEAVLRLLRDGGRTLACAESLTGGGVAARITSVPGASDAFRGSAVVYTADAKRDVLGVSPETIAGPGVVSEACAREMAAGARRVFAADLAIGLTGAAGPEPHAGAPPGTLNKSVGIKSPASTELFALSGPITPRISPLPKRSRSRAMATTWP